MSYDPTTDPRLTAYALAELHGDDVRDVEAILSQNPQAAQHVEELRRTARTLHTQLYSEPAPSLTVAQRAAIEATTLLVNRWVWPLARAACLLLAVFLGLWMHHTSQKTVEVVENMSVPAPRLPAPPKVASPPPDPLDPGRIGSLPPSGQPTPPKLPDPNFIGTVPPPDPLADLPVELPNSVLPARPNQPLPNTRMAKPTHKPRGPYRLPQSIVSTLKNIALKRPVTSSDSNPRTGGLSLVTNGDKEALDGRWVELAPGPQWVQIDLGRRSENFAVLLWHRHDEGNLVYRDVIVQASDDPAFNNPTSLFNNDDDNTSGLGIGQDYEYFETYEGLLIPLFDPDTGKGLKFRYLRCRSNGSTASDANHYTEVEVWGR